MANGMHLSGFGINVLDLDRSVEFYTDALGLEEKTKIDLGELHEVLVAGPEDRTTILLVKHAERTDVPVPGNGFEKIVLVTDDVEALYERADRGRWRIGQGAVGGREAGDQGRARA